MANNDLNEIRIFTKVAHLQSFTKAAEALNIEKSTVSTKVSQLEARLGIRLLQRTTRSVSLTDAGTNYLSYCEQALAALNQGDEYIAGLNDTPSGKLRLSTPPNFIDFIMSSVITPFLKRYPFVNLEVVEANREIDQIAENIDVAVCFSANKIEDSSLIYRKIYHSERVLVATKTFLDEFGVVEKLDDLLSVPSIGNVDETDALRESSQIYWQNQKVKLDHRFSCNNMKCVAEAIRASLGCAVMPYRMVKPDLEAGELFEVSDQVSIQPTSLYIVYPSRTGQPAKVKALVEALLEWGRFQSQ